MIVIKVDTMALKFKKVEAAKKVAIEKKTLKTKVDMKKIDDQIAKNFQIVMEKLQITKRKATLLITDGNITKKYQSNRKATIDEKLEDEPKVEKEPTS